jgi:hypothetical protein
MWILVFMDATSGGRGLPHAPALGGGVGVASGVGAGAGAGAGGVAVALGAGVATGIDGIGTVMTPDLGVFVGWVGSSSVIVWHPVRKRVPSATLQAVLFIATPSI